MKWLWWLAVPLPLAAHMVSMSTGELKVDGSRAHYELRIPMYEVAHVREPEHTLLDHIRFKSGGAWGTPSAQVCILLPIGEGNRILGQISGGKIDELIAQTYKGDHEKMKQAINNVGTVLQGLQKELARLTDASKEGKLAERGNHDQFQGAY